MLIRITYFLMIVSGTEYRRRSSPGDAAARAGTSLPHILRELICSQDSHESSLTAFLKSDNKFIIIINILTIKLEFHDEHIFSK